MRELRRRKTERLVQQHLSWRIRNVVLSTDHVRNLHQRIVDNDCKVVGGASIGSDDDRITDDLAAERDVASYQVGERDVDSMRDPETDDRTLPGVDACSRFLAAEIAAGAVVARERTGSERRLAIGIQFFRRTEAVVGMTAGNQFVGVGGIEMQALGLPIGSVWSLDIGPFVPVESEPAEVV